MTPVVVHLTHTGPNGLPPELVRSCLATPEVVYFAIPPSPATTNGAQ